MKIYPLPVDARFKPEKQNYMSSEQQERGIEDDFESWLLKSAHVTGDPDEAGWDYLPIRWNKLYVNWNWGQDGLDEIQAEVLRLVSRNRPTFTVCEYDILSMQPFYDLCGMTIFIASRHQDNAGIDIPLLCLPYRASPPPGQRRFLASFVGNLNTHTPRPEMGELLTGRADCHVEHAWKGPGYFVGAMLDSYVALCPRGYGAQSFRFYEAMQLGVAPLYISDMDARPFKRWLPWDQVSLYLSDIYELPAFLDGLKEQDLIDMGRRAKDMYYHCLQFGQWGRYVVRELERLT